MGTTIRVATLTHERFVRLARATGRPMAQLLDEAADALERKLFFDQLNERYDEPRGEFELADLGRRLVRLKLAVPSNHARYGNVYGHMAAIGATWIGSRLIVPSLPRFTGMC